MSSPPSKARGRKRKRNAGHFKPGYDPRRRAGFTREECQRGYQAAKAVMDGRSPDASAWFFRHIRGFYRRKKRQAATTPLSPHVARAAQGEEPPD